MNKIEFIELGEEDYYSSYELAFKDLEFKSEKEKDDFRKRIFDIQNLVRSELGRTWAYMNDWEVMYDFNYQYHVCGGIYSYQIFCRDYLERIIKVLNNVEESAKWTFHTTCEILDDSENLLESGEFFIRDEKVYFPKDEIDYLSRFQVTP